MASADIIESVSHADLKTILERHKEILLSVFNILTDWKVGKTSVQIVDYQRKPKGLWCQENCYWTSRSHPCLYNCVATVWYHLSARQRNVWCKFAIKILHSSDWKLFTKGEDKEVHLQENKQDAQRHTPKFYTHRITHNAHTWDGHNAGV